MNWKPIVLYVVLICAVVSTCILLNDAAPNQWLLDRYYSGERLFIILSETQLNQFRMNILRDHALIALSWFIFAFLLIAFLVKKRGKAATTFLFVALLTLTIVPLKVNAETIPQLNYYSRVQVTLKDMERFVCVSGYFTPQYDISNSKGWTAHHIGVITVNGEWLAGGYIREQGKSPFYIEALLGKCPVEIHSEEEVVYGKRYGIRIDYAYDMGYWTICIFDPSNGRVIMNDHATFSPSNAVVDLLVAGSECPSSHNSMSAGFDELWYGGKSGPSQYHYSKFFNSTYVACQKIEYSPFAVDMTNPYYCFRTYIQQRNIANSYLIRNNQVIGENFNHIGA
jgi:hypothetical protein